MNSPGSGRGGSVCIRRLKIILFVVRTASVYSGIRLVFQADVDQFGRAFINLHHVEAVNWRRRGINGKYSLHFYENEEIRKTSG